MGLEVSRRSFLKALSAGVALTIFPAASVIAHTPGPQQVLKLVGGYMEEQDFFWLRVTLTEKEREFHHLIRITNRPTDKLYAALTNSVNNICKEQLARPIKEREVIKAFAERM